MQSEQPIRPIYSPPSTPKNSVGSVLKRKRVMAKVGVLAAALLLIMVFATVLGGQRSATEITLTSVTARNSEVLRLIEELESELATASGKTYATQAKILLTSDNLAITSYTGSVYLTTHSIEQVARVEIATVIKELSKRIGQYDFDEVFISSVQFEIELNRALLEQLNLKAPNEPLSSIVQAALVNHSSLL